MAVSIDLFDVLLMEISNNLSNDNLRSLKHVCRNYLNENQRETIKHGLEVFDILRKRDVVTAETDKIENLLRIITAMRPKRKDLIRKVQRFIIKNQIMFSEPNVISFRRDELEDSFSNQEVNDDNSERSKSVDSTSPPRSRCCSFDICCCDCNCYSIRVPPCVYASLLVFMILLTIFAVLAWYADEPRIHPFVTKNTDLKTAGKYIIALLCVVTGVVFVLFIYTRRAKSKPIGILAPKSDYGSINRRNATPSRQQSFQSLPGYGNSAKDISYEQYSSLSTSGFSSRLSSKLSTPPLFTNPKASVEQKQNIYASGCMDETTSLFRQQFHGPTGMQKRKDYVVTGISNQACGERMDSDVEPDSDFQVPQRSLVKQDKSLSQSFSSDLHGVFFPVTQDEDVFSYNEKQDKNYNW